MLTLPEKALLGKLYYQAILSAILLLQPYRQKESGEDFFLKSFVNEKPEDLTRKDEIEWLSKNSDAIAYIKLSLADEQALQFAAEDNAKVLWDKIRVTFIGRGEDRRIDAGNEFKNIRMKNGETVGDYIARARGISTKCLSLGLDVSPRKLVYHKVRGLNGKFSKVRDILKTQKRKSMEEVLQILREEETTFNLPIKTRMDGVNAEAFYSRRKMKSKRDFSIFVEKQTTRQRTVTIETRTLQLQAKGI
ncbi:retrovirus-related Pol polyprotein from transposon TNT 1-94 [Trichonephila clavipes]|nr:retrovirus-related Pol polyprotein from transposon TNT 1-94 [Trichonephila clavipes]